MFFTNGVLFSNLLPRYPEVKDTFALSDAAFGLLVVCFPVGSILAAATAAPLVRRFGARWVMSVGSVLLAAVLALAGGAPTALLFGALLLIGGLLDAIVDTAQNVQAVIVERWRGRSIINSFHAIWSLGATCGGLIGTWGAANHVPLATQLLVNGLVWSVVAVAAGMLAAAPPVAREVRGDAAPAADSSNEQGGGDAPDRSAATPRMRPWKLLAPLAVLAISGTLLEEFANSWSALFILRETDAPAQFAGLGFTVMLASQFVGRMVGDPMTDRWGRAAVARSGGVIISIGVLLAMLGSGLAWALTGFALVGFGCATLVPAAFAASAEVPGLRHGTGIAILGWLLRIGFLVTSPVIGVISDYAGLRLALLVPLGAGITAAAISHALARRSPHPSRPSR